MTSSQVERATVRMVGRSFAYTGKMPEPLRLAYESGRVRFGRIDGSRRGALPARSGVVGTVLAKFDARDSGVVAMDRDWDGPAARLAEEAAAKLGDGLSLSEPGEFVFRTVCRRYGRTPKTTAPVHAVTVAVAGYEVSVPLRRRHRAALGRMERAGVAVADGDLRPLVVGVHFSLGGSFVPADAEAAHRRSAALLDVALSMAPPSLAEELAATGEPGWFLLSTTRLSAPWVLPENAR